MIRPANGARPITNAQLNDSRSVLIARMTRWDGKMMEQRLTLPGRYHPRGVLVGPLKREDLGETSPPPTSRSERGESPIGPQSFAER